MRRYRCAASPSRIALEVKVLPGVLSAPPARAGPRLRERSLVAGQLRPAANRSPCHPELLTSLDQGRAAHTKLGGGSELLPARLRPREPAGASPAPAGVDRAGELEYTIA
jgi:hypothetical protein